MANITPDSIATCEASVRVCNDKERTARRAAGRGDVETADEAPRIAAHAALAVKQAADAAGPWQQHPYEQRLANRAHRLAAHVAAHATFARQIAAGGVA